MTNDWRNKKLSDYLELEQDALVRCIDPDEDQRQASKDLKLIKKEKERIKRYYTQAMYFKFLRKENRQIEKFTQLSIIWS